MADAVSRFSNQPGYWHVLYTGQTVHAPGTPLPSPGELASKQDQLLAAMHGIVAAVLAMALALTSVYRHKLAKALRLGSFLKTRLQPLRNLQSGHPGNYVVWLTTGVSAFGLLVILLLRH